MASSLLLTMWRPYFAVRTTVFLCSAGETLPRLGTHLQLSRMRSTRTADYKAGSESTSQELEQNPKKLIWEDYKRNHKGSIPPRKVRLRCKRNVRRQVGNPCPICRNEVALTYTNVDLLKQFISPHTGKILDSYKTGVCRLQQKKLVEAIEKAVDHGLLPYMVSKQEHKGESSRTTSTPPPWNKIHLLED